MNQESKLLLKCYIERNRFTDPFLHHKLYGEPEDRDVTYPRSLFYRGDDFLDFSYQYFSLEVWENPTGLIAIQQSFDDDEFTRKGGSGSSTPLNIIREGYTLDMVIEAIKRRGYIIVKLSTGDTSFIERTWGKYDILLDECIKEIVGNGNIRCLLDKDFLGCTNYTYMNKHPELYRKSNEMMRLWMRMDIKSAEYQVQKEKINNFREDNNVGIFPNYEVLRHHLMDKQGDRPVHPIRELKRFLKQYQLDKNEKQTIPA